MPSSCPCFGRNPNCRLCDGSGIITAKIETKVADSSFKFRTSDNAGNSYELLRDEAEKKRQELKLTTEQKAEQAKKDAEESEKSIAYWKKRWGKK